MSEIEQIQQIVEQVKIYRFISFVFGIFGFIVFLVVYKNYVDGQIINAITSLRSVFAMITPFIPTIIFLMMAQKLEKQADKMARDLQSKR